MHSLTIKSPPNFHIIEVLGEKDAILNTQSKITTPSSIMEWLEIPMHDTLNDMLAKVKPIFEDSTKFAVIKYQKGHFFPISKGKLLEGVGNDEKGLFTKKFLDSIVVTDEFELLSDDMWYSKRDSQLMKCSMITLPKIGIQHI